MTSPPLSTLSAFLLGLLLYTGTYTHYKSRKKENITYVISKITFSLSGLWESLKLAEFGLSVDWMASRTLLLLDCTYKHVRWELRFMTKAHSHLPKCYGQLPVAIELVWFHFVFVLTCSIEHKGTCKKPTGTYTHQKKGNITSGQYPLGKSTIPSFWTTSISQFSMFLWTDALAPASLSSMIAPIQRNCWIPVSDWPKKVVLFLIGVIMKPSILDTVVRKICISL